MRATETASAVTEKNQALRMDELDMRITNALLDNPDVSSAHLSRKFSKPLSTIQRRRARLERTILVKSYNINAKYTNFRSGEIFLNVEKGKTEEVGRQLFEKYAGNITLVSTTMNNVGNLIGHIYFKDLPEMFAIVEQLKRIEFVRDVLYAEHIALLGERKPKFMIETLKKSNGGRAKGSKL